MALRYLLDKNSENISFPCIDSDLCSCEVYIFYMFLLKFHLDLTKFDVGVAACICNLAT